MYDTTYSSNNHSDRAGEAVELFVLHATVGSLASSLSWLCNPKSGVSTHYVISKTGRVFRLVPESRCAWHAGRARWGTKTKVNEISIGIELENLTGMKDSKGRLLFEGQDPYPAPQVEALTALARDLLARYRFGVDRFVRHVDVAVPYGRKSDPIGFPWEGWRASLLGGRYRVARVPVYQRQDLTGAIAGYLNTGEPVELDMTYPNGAGHLASGLGFVRLDRLEKSS